MTRRWTGLSLALLLGAVAGCGKDEAKPTSGSCNIPSLYLCIDLNPALSTDPADCASVPGTWSTAACPTANLVGSCLAVYGGQTANLRFYLPTDDASAQAMCIQSFGGTYTPTCAYLQASCDLQGVTGQNDCIEFYCGVVPSTDQPNCTGLGGTWSTTAICSPLGLTGICKVVTGGGQTRSYFLYPPLYPDDTAGRAFCTSAGGTYTP